MTSQRPEDSLRDAPPDAGASIRATPAGQVINPWLEPGSGGRGYPPAYRHFPRHELAGDNRHPLKLLLENTSVPATARRARRIQQSALSTSPHRDNNRFIAVCQLKVRDSGHRAPHCPRHRAVPEWPAGGGDRVQVAQGQRRHPEAIDQLLRYSEQRGKTRRRQCTAFLLQPDRDRHLPQRSQIRHDHHPQREAFLPLG